MSTPPERRALVRARSMAAATVMVGFLAVPSSAMALEGTAAVLAASTPPPTVTTQQDDEPNPLSRIALIGVAGLSLGTAGVLVYRRPKADSARRENQLPSEGN